MDSRIHTEHTPPCIGDDPSVCAILAKVHIFVMGTYPDGPRYLGDILFLVRVGIYLEVIVIIIRVPGFYPGSDLAMAKNETNRRKREGISVGGGFSVILSSVGTSVGNHTTSSSVCWLAAYFGRMYSFDVE